MRQSLIDHLDTAYRDWIEGDDYAGSQKTVGQVYVDALVEWLRDNAETMVNEDWMFQSLPFEQMVDLLEAP